MLLSDLIPFLKENSKNTKIHFAKGKNDPQDALRAFIMGNFKEFQEEQNNKNFEKDYIVSLIRLGDGEWVFAGVYRSYGSKPIKVGRKTAYKYRTKLLEEGSELIGRAIIGFKRDFRQSYCLLESYKDYLEVIEVRRDEYNLPFPGYDNVCVTWEELYTVIDTEEWMKPLKNRKGVYLITDLSNGNLYVGSATGRSKLWRRWKNYIDTCDGGNEGLKKLSKKHIRECFQYTILETYTANADDKEIRRREQWWKKALKSKEFGYNEN